MGDAELKGPVFSRLMTRLRRGVLAGTVALHLAALAGLFFWLLASMGVLHECVHALGHSGHRYSILAKLFDDGSPVPVVVAVCLIVAYELLVETENRREREEGHGSLVFLRVLPLFLAVCAAAVAALAAALWMLDLRSAPLERMGPTAPFETLVIAVVTLDVACAVTAAVFHFTRRMSVAVVTIALPLAVSSVLVFGGPGRTSALYRADALPAAYPTPMKFLVLTAVVAAAYAAPVFLAWRSVPAAVARGVLVFPGALGSLAIFAVVCFGLILPFHHLCFQYRHGGPQRAGTVAVALAFVALWAIIGAVQWERRRRTREGHDG